MQIRNRIKELRHVPACDLRPNPKNWRTHPKAQQDALRGILAEVGMADACLARELDDGTLMLIDGHLRAETIGEEVVPVLILDVDEAEADKILATLDPLAAMAGADEDMLHELLSGIETESESVRAMLQETERMASAASDEVDDNGDNPYTAKVDIPQYEISGPKPLLSELFDSSKAEKLIEEVEKSPVDEEEKAFLRAAAMRHVVFNYEKIANYYAHSNSEMQRLLENSACVIVDIEKAIENGWAKLDAVLSEQYSSEKEQE